MGSIYFLFVPLCVSIVFSYNTYSVLSSGTAADDKTLLFEIVFIIVWLGGGIIAINGQLLGGTISFF